ncbi:MAG: hypothetical protein CVV27_04815 [Candidatus Melainabacteria bacterium HGW-Melainabacteria-1]|nr:MAG: hypothetical protein CVV27_04815 [Candidatus Melainabacteria bacterium HGW-Melainabacteria-1]
MVAPAVPAARRFLSQSGQTDMWRKWFPRPNGDESNSLVFYKAPAPGAGGTSQIERITYRLQQDTDAAGYRRSRLLREVQRPLTAASTNFGSNPAPIVTVLADEVQVLQFSYPIFEQQMTAALHTQWNLIEADPDPTKAIELLRTINSNYRKVIGIRIVMGGARLGPEIKGSTPPLSAGVELRTEVRLRSE